MAASDHARLASLRLRGAVSHHVQTAVGRMHVLDVPGRGPLPPLVLLHGLSSCSADFSAMFSRLRDYTQRIIAPDLPGHGWSDAPPDASGIEDIIGSLVHTLDEVLDRPAFVFGNSLGGLVALRYAMAMPRRAAGLFVVSPAGATSNARDEQVLRETVSIRTRTEAIAFVERALPDSGWMTPLLALGVRARLGRPSVRRLVERSDLTGLLHPAALSSLPMPIHWVWGAKERLLPIAHRDFFARHMPAHATCEFPRHFGHAPQVRFPDEVADRLLDFARRSIAVVHRPTSARTAVAG